MKRLLAILSVLLLLCIPVLSLASGTETPPPEVLALKPGQAHDLRGYISFTLPDGAVESFWLDYGGFMDGFRCENGEWSIQSQVSPVDGTWDAQLVRHDPTVLHANGSQYQDALGFDILCRKTGNRLSYHYNGKAFVLCGWENPSAYAGTVMLNGLTANYYPTGSNQPEGSYRLGEFTDTLLMSFEDLPFTPAEAASMAAITEGAVADAYPGYALHWYESFNANAEAYACYSRIENGLLYVKRVNFYKEKQPFEVDLMPVPLAPALLEKLATEPFEQLLNLSGQSALFCTDATVDPACIAVAGRIVDSDLQQKALLLLVEDAQGTRRLQVVSRVGESYTAKSTRPLPDGAWLDVFHAGDGNVLIEWMEEHDGQPEECYASYSQLPDGTWQLESVAHGGQEDAIYSLCFCGPRLEYSLCSSDGILMGTIPDSGLFSADLRALPTVDQLAVRLDRSGWAKVNNPDPADRLHLRTQPTQTADSLGRFYNGTPVRVLEEKGEWCRVEIGLDGRLTGWMMKQYLAFGESMDAVACAFPQQVLRDRYDGQKLYTSKAMEAQTTLDGEMWVVGIAEGDLYVLLTPDGGTAYAPIAWFFEGNG